MAESIGTYRKYQINGWQYVLMTGILTAFLIVLGLVFLNRMKELHMQDQIPVLMVGYFISGVLFVVTLAIYVQLPELSNKTAWYQLANKSNKLTKDNYKRLYYLISWTCVVSGIGFFASILWLFYFTVFTVGPTIEKNPVKYQINVVEVEDFSHPSSPGIPHGKEAQLETMTEHVVFQKHNKEKMYPLIKLGNIESMAWSKTFKAIEGEKLMLAISSDKMTFRGKILVGGRVVKEQEGKEIRLSYQIPHE